jgi:hypothetical protein
MSVLVVLGGLLALAVLLFVALETVPARTGRTSRSSPLGDGQRPAARGHPRW